MTESVEQQLLMMKSRERSDHQKLLQSDDFFNGIPENEDQRSSKVQPFSVEQSVGNFVPEEENDDLFAHLNDDDDLVLKHTQRNRKQIRESDNNTQKQVKND